MALSAKKQLLIEIMIAEPTASHIKLAEAVGVNRNTITSWKRNEEFQAAYKERLREVWKDGEAIAVQTMLNLAEKGNYNAAAYILDNMGYKAATKVEADVNTDIVINIGGED